MSSHSDHPHTLQSDCATPTRTHAPCKIIDSGKITQSHQKERGKMRSQRESHRHAICATTIDILTDDVLLEVFDLVRSSSAAYKDRFYPVWEWYPLVHVCSRWREIIFASPLRLDLQLHCTHGTPVKKGLGCWPPTFPIAIDYGYCTGTSLSPDDEDNMFAALEQHKRVRLLRLSITTAVLEKMVTLIQVSFPELRHLTISSRGLDIPILTDGFLGGSAPSLREISLSGIPFPALPTLLSSASGLVELVLVDIPQTADFPPAACVACLADLPRLERLSFFFF
ncbi:hypothetical protein EDB85DRAFT_1507531 [Lactarius pseudohatsudake]|nr:hypothetical protein EDB85DRAFT_1507531 [Lactarius pseudohatsudake]